MILNAQEALKEEKSLIPADLPVPLPAPATGIVGQRNPAPNLPFEGSDDQSSAQPLSGEGSKTSPKMSFSFPCKYSC